MLHFPFFILSATIGERNSEHISSSNLFPLLLHRTEARNRKMRLETPFAFIIMRVKRDHRRRARRAWLALGGGKSKNGLGEKGRARARRKAPPKCEMLERDHCESCVLDVHMVDQKD